MNIETYAAIDRLVTEHCSMFDAGIAARLRTLVHVDSVQVQQSIFNHITDRCSAIGNHMAGMQTYVNNQWEWEPDLRSAIETLVEEIIEVISEIG